MLLHVNIGDHLTLGWMQLGRLFLDEEGVIFCILLLLDMEASEALLGLYWDRFRIINMVDQVIQRSTDLFLIESSVPSVLQ